MEGELKSGKTLIKFNNAGFRKVLTSPGCRFAVESAAAQLRARAGAGFAYSVKIGGFGGGRWIAYVRGTALGNRREATEKALSRAVGA